MHTLSLYPVFPFVIISRGADLPVCLVRSAPTVAPAAAVGDPALSLWGAHDIAVAHPG